MRPSLIGGLCEKHVGQGLAPAATARASSRWKQRGLSAGASPRPTGMMGQDRTQASAVGHSLPLRRSRDGGREKFAILLILPVYCRVFSPPVSFADSPCWAPGKAFGFVWERRSSAMSELSHSCGSEGYEACDDDRGGLSRCCRAETVCALRRARCPQGLRTLFSISSVP